jgi:parallel beta-helix repeat protein
MHDLSIAQGLTAKKGCIDIKASNVFLLLNGYSIAGDNTKSGIGIHVLPGAKSVFVEGVASEDSTANNSFVDIVNWDVGILWEGAQGILDDVESALNGTAGIVLNRATGNVISDFTLHENAVYGMWLKASSNNQIECGSISSNDNAGLYLGCSPSGPSGKRCKGVGPSNKNHLYDMSSTNNAIGIAIDLGNSGNAITDNFTFNNGTADLADKNPACGNDLWYGNDFDTQASDSGCIQ